jgi:ABC-type transport system involved in multi-copper enzyme maturation permease subunit
MDSLTPSSEFWIAGVIFFGMAVFTCAGIVWILVAVYSQTPSPSTVGVRLDEVELAVRNRERAQAELPSDRLLGTAAAADTNNAVTVIT